MSRGWIYLLLFVLIATFYAAYYARITAVTPAVTTVTPHPQTKVVVSEPVIKEPNKPIRLLSTVPFYSQAPFGLWDPLHEDACEEAALLMVKYWQDRAEPSLADYDQTLKDFISWQTLNSYDKSISISELGQVSEDYFKFKLKIATVNSETELKKLLDEGRPVIWPADGKKLKNPHFKNGGPPYHMLVVIGYENSTFITQDPGTRFGENYRYSAEVLLAAQGNWDGSRPVNTDHRVLTTID